LVLHFKDVSNHYNLLHANVLWLVKTWLSNSNYVDGIQLNGYNFIHRTRQECFESTHALHTLGHGGVGVYVKEGIPFESVLLTDSFSVECMTVHLPTINLHVLVVYRHAKHSKTDFLSALQSITHVIGEKNRIIIVADINENSLSDNKSHLIDESFLEVRFLNLFHDVPTTNEFTCIDRCYVNFDDEQSFHTVFIHNYYSFHEDFGISVALYIANDATLTAESNEIAKKITNNNK
ncbi:unnamed protein product, partial [Didymodactylos carnosus]